MKNLRTTIGKIFKKKYDSYGKFDSIFTSKNREIHQFMVRIIIDQIINSNLNQEKIEEYVIQQILPLADR